MEALSIKLIRIKALLNIEEARVTRRCHILQAILGHRSIDVTIDLYGQLQAVDVDELNLY